MEVNVELLAMAPVSSTQISMTVFPSHIMTRKKNPCWNALSAGRKTKKFSGFGINDIQGTDEDLNKWCVKEDHIN
eukprot:183213-Ditylum_brightwellii.AAC.1